MFAWPRILVCATLIAVGLCAPVMAKEPQPAVVVSLASPDKLLADVAYLTQAVDQPAAGRMAALMADPYLSGVDRERPAGAYVTYQDTEPQIVGFVAVKDIKQVLATLSDALGEAQAVGEEGWRFPGLFIKQQGTWAFAARQEEHLQDLPADPLVLLAGLEKKYTVAASVDPSRIPAAARRVFLVDVKNLFAAQMTEADGQPAEAAMQKYVVETVTMLVEGTEKVVFGWKTDTKAKQTALDFELAALPKSPLAERLALALPAHPPLGNFDLPGAAFYGRRANAMSDDERTMIKEMFENAQQQLKKINNDPTLPAEERAKRNAQAEAALPMMDLFREAEYLDQAAVGLVEGDEFSAVMGVSLAPNSDWNKLARNMVAQMQKDSPDAKIEVKYDVAKVGLVSLHQITAENAEEAIVNLIGEKQTYTVGTAPGRLYVAMGPDGEKTLRGILTAKKSPMKEEMYVARVLAKPFVRLAAERFEQPAAELLLERIQETDQIDIVANTAGNRFTAHAKVDEGVLRSFGTLFAEIARSLGAP